MLHVAPRTRDVDRTAANRAGRAIQARVVPIAVEALARSRFAALAGRNAIAIVSTGGPDPRSWSSLTENFSGTLIDYGGCHEAQTVRG